MYKKFSREHVEIKIIRLRQLASRGRGEPLRVFKEIEKDPKCNWILRQYSIVESDETIVECYNKHIRQSKLSDEQKKSLVI